MHIRLALSAALTLATLVVPAMASAGGGASYHYRTVDFPGFYSTCSVNGLNNAGRFVGAWDDAGGLFHGLIGQSDGAQVARLDFPGAVQTFPISISNRGDVAGTYIDAIGVQHGFVMTKNGAFHSVDDPAAVVTSAEFEFGPGLGTAGFGINDHGVVVGQYSDAAGVGHGFILQGDAFQTYDAPGAAALPGLGVGGTQLVRVNDRMDLAGNFGDGNPDPSQGFHGFFLRHGHFTPLNVPGATFTQVLGLSSDGTVTGFFTTDFDFIGGKGFLWQDGHFTEVAGPAPGPQGFATVASVNARGEISGEYVDGPFQHCYIGTPED